MHDHQDKPSSADRRTFLRVGGAAALAAAAAACAPSASAPPSAAPSGAPTAKPAWETQWDELVAAAKKDGALTIMTGPDAGYRKALDVFEDKFPGITINREGARSASIWFPKVQKERQAGVFSFDIMYLTPGSAIRLAKPEGFWDPIRPMFVRPDVMEEKSWLNGFEAGFLDVEQKFAYAADYNLEHAVAINTTLVKPDEIKNIKDLLDPKWKGKIFAIEVRNGRNFQAMGAVRRSQGDAILKQLMVDQEPVFVRDERIHVEGLIRGQYPVGIGLHPHILAEFKAQGVGKEVTYLNLDEADYVTSDSVFLFNRAPHPNAAKLFINWVLSREGATAWSTNVGTNSRRSDVPPANELRRGKAGVKYYDPTRESEHAFVEKTQQMLYELLGIKN
mgnify:CR=1 FL=1